MLLVRNVHQSGEPLSHYFQLEKKPKFCQLSFTANWLLLENTPSSGLIQYLRSNQIYSELEVYMLYVRYGSDACSIYMNVVLNLFTICDGVVKLQFHVNILLLQDIHACTENKVVHHCPMQVLIDHQVIDHRVDVTIRSHLSIHSNSYLELMQGLVSSNFIQRLFWLQIFWLELLIRNDILLIQGKNVGLPYCWLR